MRNILAVFEYIILLIVVINYVLSSRALYVLAKRRGINSPCYAWIPVGRDWILGNIVDGFDRKNGNDKKIGKIMFVLSVTAVLVFFVSIILVSSIIMTLRYALFIKEVQLVFSALEILLTFTILTIWVAKKAFVVLCVYKLFESTVPEKSVKYLLVYFIIPFADAICLYKCRNKGYSKDEILIKNTMVSQGNGLSKE